MNSRLCPSHWLIYSSQRTSSGGNESLHSPLLLCLFLSFVIFLKAAWRKPTTDASMSCPQWRRRWRVSALESCGGGVADPGNSLTDWLTERHAAEDEERETDREREGQWERERERVRVVEKEGESERVTCLMSNCSSQCRDRIDALSDLAPPCVGGNAMGI